MKKISAIMLCLCLTLGQVFVPGETQASEPAKMISNGPIAPGVTHSIYNWQTSYGPIRLSVLTCDLNNPNLDLRVVPGQGSFTKRATVSQMANRTDAVALVNGDYFNMALQGSPIGPTIIDGTLHSSPARILGIYSLGIDDKKTASIEYINFQGSMKAPNGTSYPVDGLNKTIYWHEPYGAESHTDTIQVYDDFWTSPSRGHNTNSEALINKDGIIEQISIGKTLPMAVPKGKKIIQFSGRSQDFVTKNFSVGAPANLSYTIEPNRNWQLMIGGHALVLDNGEVVPYTKDINVLGGVRARTGAGVSKDGKTIWIVSAEGRTNRSVGATLTTMGYFFKQLGASRAVNLDGGGSTAMVSKTLGENNRHHDIYPERMGYERAVVNGLGVYNHLPATGVLKGFHIQRFYQMYFGETKAITVNRAWDTNLKPLDSKKLQLTYSDNKNTGKWNGSYFTPLEVGSIALTAEAENGVKDTHIISVKDFSDITGFTVTQKKLAILGEPLQTDFQIYNPKWQPITVDPRVIQKHVSGAKSHLDEQTGLVVLDAFTAPWATINYTAGKYTKQTLIENPEAPFMKLYLDQSYYEINRQKKTMDAKAVVQKDRTIVPVRFIVEELGGKVSWDEENRIVGISIQGHQINLPIDKNYVEMDGKQVAIDVPATIIGERTYVPIRFISENIGLKVGYNTQERTVLIAK